MNGDDLTGLLIFLTTVLPLGDLAATIFFSYLILKSKQPVAEEDEARAAYDAEVPGAQRPFVTRLLGGRSWLLALLTASFAMITVAFIVIGFLAGRRLLGFQPLEHGALYTLLVLIPVGLIPIVFAIVFYMTRRRRGGSPPPFGNSD
jgi:hypothetical protein